MPKIAPTIYILCYKSAAIWWDGQ